VTPYDHFRIALGTVCLALSFHPLLAGATDTRENVDCQIISIGMIHDPFSSSVFKCGGAEVSMTDSSTLMGLVHSVKRHLSVHLKTRWVRCRLTETKRPIAFGLLPDSIFQSINACKPLMVAPTPRRWVCYMAQRGTCHA
jgi:hypothetical protein